MKFAHGILGLFGTFLVACGGGDYTGGGPNPLDTAGTQRGEADVVDTGFRAGEFVETVMSDTAFFSERPAGEAEAETLLDAGTVMKVVALDGSYTKVERDEGAVGYVLTMMLIKEGEGGTPDMEPVDFEGDEAPVEIIPLNSGEAEEPAADLEEEVTPVLPTEVDPDGE